MEEAILRSVPLRERGDCPVPIDEVFKRAPRWKRREMIQRAYALDDARRRALKESQDVRALEATPICVDGLSQREVDAAVRARAAEVLAGGALRGSRRWVVPRSGFKQWTEVFEAPTRVHLLRGGEQSSLTLWPRHFCAELVRELKRTTPRCRVGARPGQRDCELIIRIEATSSATKEGKGELP